MLTSGCPHTQQGKHYPSVRDSVLQGMSLRQQEHSSHAVGCAAVLATMTRYLGQTWTHRHITRRFFPLSRSSTYRPKGFDVTVKYTQGSWTGLVGEDLVTLPKGFNSSFLVNIATIFESENFFLPGIKWNGILGLAYAALAKVRPQGCK